MFLERRFSTPPMSFSINTSRLLIRSTRPQETQAYGLINELRGSPQDWHTDWASWSSRGAKQLFIILRGYHNPNINAPSVAEGMVIGFIKIAGSRNEVSFRTHPSFRGEGIMKEALRATFTYIFQRWRNIQLYVETRSDNLAVVRMMQEFGLQGQRGGWSSVGSVWWNFGWASWRTWQEYSHEHGSQRTPSHKDAKGKRKPAPKGTQQLLRHIFTASETIGGRLTQVVSTFSEA
ncbi:hypothetical protein BKA65DRAFT_484657 [Rhexocercosporidium sp. MPI-PUGE-AT-0058]|nr:hypothetical protein BKA65DRAFT_484657 [Rhexocercosporidium sp. MPI-PUGE-AT-0058]